MSKQSTYIMEEVEKFDALAERWWDPVGEFKLLHEMNPCRLKYIKAQICRAFHLSGSKMLPFTGLRALDVGCGGGLISVPIYNMGAQVTGIDASYNNIQTAKAYALRYDLGIDFRHVLAENLSEDAQFDVVLALEVIEHVQDYQFFLAQMSRLLRPGGILIISTLNRTLKSLLLAKITAEYILRLLPMGTHDWSKFLTPEELEEVLTKHDMNLLDLSGIEGNPFTQNWKISSNKQINYIMTFQKQLA